MKRKRVSFNEIEKLVRDNKMSMSQAEIARRMNISKNTLMKTLRNKSLKLTMFEDLCELLQVHPLQFYLDIEIEYEKISDIELSTKVRDVETNYEIFPTRVHEAIVNQLEKEIEDLKEIIFRIAK